MSELYDLKDEINYLQERIVVKDVYIKELEDDLKALRTSVINMSEVLHHTGMLTRTASI